MSLRKLELRDAEFMLEWMHGISVVGNLQGNFLEKTISDCRKGQIPRPLGANKLKTS